MHVLILGGTRFAGRAVTDAALSRGDTVTLFNRGRTNAGLYPQAETIITLRPRRSSGTERVT